jgi:hypothetical protein
MCSCLILALIVALQFKDRHLPCKVLIPSGDSYSETGGSQNFTGSYRTQSACSVVPTAPGNYQVLGDEYISNLFDFDASHLWRRVVIP